VARSYYKTGDLYLFDDFQVSREPGSRRPPCDNLLDVFTNIAIDEGEHVKTMQACQDYARFGVEVVSPHLKFDDDIESREIALDEAQVEEIVKNKRALWKKWCAEINE
jgi:hypothetical protein